MAGKIQFIKALKTEPCSYWPDADVPAQLYALTGLNYDGTPPIGVKAHELMRPAHLEGVRKGFLAVNFGVVAPVCSTCRACVPLRVSTEKFALSDSQARMMAKNRYSFDLVETRTLTPPHELYAVFKDYVLARHAEENSGMHRWNRSQFYAWLEFMPFMLTARKPSGRLIGFAAINGDMDTAILEYIAFNPAEAKHSPGKQLWLAMMMQMKEAALPHVYVGSWAKDSPKLDYKRHHSGLETFNGTEWIDFDPRTHVSGPDYRTMLEREGFDI